MPSAIDHPQPLKPAQDRTLLGIGVVILGWLAFACMDAGSKLLVSTYPIVQILWLRYLFLVLIAYWLLARKGLRLRSSRPLLQLSRGLLLVVEIGFVIYAFSKMQLADVHAILAITPLIVTALSVPLLGEKVGLRRWSAVGVAFVGMLIILRPGFIELQPVTLLVLLAALMFSLYLVLTRLISRTEPLEQSLFWIAITGFVGLTFLVPFHWQTPTRLADIGLFAFVAVFGAIGHFSLIKALELAEASVLQPYNYTLLVAIIVVGYVVFDDLPDLLTTIGAAVIMASGLYVFARERRLRGVN